MKFLLIWEGGSCNYGDHSVGSEWFDTLAEAQAEAKDHPDCHYHIIRGEAVDEGDISQEPIDWSGLSDEARAFYRRQCEAQLKNATDMMNLLSAIKSGKKIKFNTE